MLDVELPELVVLKHNLQRITWLEEVADTKEDEDEVTLDVLRSLLDAGVELPPHPLVEKEMACLQVSNAIFLISGYFTKVIALIFTVLATFNEC